MSEVCGQFFFTGGRKSAKQGIGTLRNSEKRLKGEI